MAAFKAVPWGISLVTKFKYIFCEILGENSVKCTVPMDNQSAIRLLIGNRKRMGSWFSNKKSTSVEEKTINT